MKRVTKDLRDTVRHEAGHALVAFLLGWKPRSLDLTPREDRAGCVTLHKNHFRYMRGGRWRWNEDHSCAGLRALTPRERRSAIIDAYVSLAGGAATNVSGGWGDDESDWKQADYTMRFLYPSLTKRQRQDRLYSLWFQVKEVLDRRSVQTVLLRVQRTLLSEFTRTGKRQWSSAELRCILDDASRVRVTARLDYSARSRLPVLDSFFSHVGR